MSDKNSPPLVGIIMGSQSDWETMQHAALQLDELGVPYESLVISADRTPDLLSNTPPARLRAAWKSSSPRRAARPISPA